MTAAVLLLAWVVLAAWPGSAWLSRRSFDRAPALGVAIWQLLSASAVIALVLAGAALAAGTDPLSHALARVLETCELLVKAEYSAPGGVAGPVIGTSVVVLVLARVGLAVVATVREGRRRRRAWRMGLSLVAVHDPSADVFVLPHPEPAAYCVPGGRGTVVITTAAVRALSPGQLRAVLDHERSHLRYHHHVVVTAASVLAQALPFLPVLDRAHHQLQRLVELMADDRAATAQGRQVVAAAIDRVCSPDPIVRPGPGGRTAERVRRLSGPARPLRRPLTGGLLTGAALAMGTPALLFMVPLLAATVAPHCSVGMHCG